MKKDKKFLKELENNLTKVREKHRKEIISKYENIIQEEKAKRKKITVILKELGDPKEIAKKEMKAYKGESFFAVFGSKIKGVFKKKNKKNNDFVKEEKKRIKEELKEEKKKEKELKKQEKKNNKTPFKEKLNKFKLLITKDIKLNKKEKEKLEKEEEKKEEFEEAVEVVSESFTDVKDEIADVAEIVPEKKIFESKKDRRRRILLKTLCVILTILLLVIWLWVSVIFIASVFAYLDGIKFIGINIALFGVDALVLWIVIMVNRAIFKKKTSLKLNLIVSIILILVTAVGIVLAIRQISEIKTVKDVSVKYSMTTKLSSYELPNDIDQKFTITFNSNYDTQYTMNYDDTLKNKIKVEVRYYECYYDYYVKETSNSSYISLKLDNRDRLSVYIDDLKEGMVLDNDELSRYVVRISINPDDIGRLVIND